MKSIITSLIFTVVLFFVSGLEARSHLCPLNEQWSDCISHFSCRPTCGSYEPKACTLECAGSGCECNDGCYRRSTDNKCVPRKDCDQSSIQCPQNQTYTDCGTTCPPTCEVPQPQYCNYSCIEGCLCNKGYYKKKDGSCVKLSECQ